MSLGNVYDTQIVKSARVEIINALITTSFFCKQRLHSDMSSSSSLSQKATLRFLVVVTAEYIKCFDTLIMRKFYVRFSKVLLGMH